jgi:hypothetical protein
MTFTEATQMNHGLITPRDWKAYGSGYRNRPNPNQEFTWLWANLIAHQGTTNQDRLESFHAFMEGFNA